MNSKREIKFIRTPYPIDGKRKILDEQSFRSLYLNTLDTLREVSEKNDIPFHIVKTSIAYYKTIFPEEVKKKKSISMRQMSLKRENQQLKINKDQMISLIAEGKTESDIAKELKVSPSVVRKKVRSWGLHRPSIRLYGLSKEEWEMIEKLDILYPGFMDVSYRAIDEPIEFFHTLYNLFIEWCKIGWMITKLSRRYDYYRLNRNIPRNYISWRNNKHEILVSEELRKMNIEHYREYQWAKSVGRNFSADIYFPGKNFIVEINGIAHTIWRIKKLDKEKEQLAKELGIYRLVFTTSEVEKNLSGVIQKITQALSDL